MVKGDLEPNGQEDYPNTKAKASATGAMAKTKAKGRKDNKKVIPEPVPKTKTRKKYEWTSYELAKKKFDEKPC